MIFRTLDSNNDWVFGKGKSDYRTDAEALYLNIETKLREWKYNCFFNKDAGVDYKNYLDRGTKDYLDSDIKRVILTTDGVLRISAYESELEDRELTVTVSILTIYGNLEVDFIQEDK